MNDFDREGLTYKSFYTEDYLDFFIRFNEKTYNFFKVQKSQEFTTSSPLHQSDEMISLHNEIWAISPYSGSKTTQDSEIIKKPEKKKLLTPCRKTGERCLITNNLIYDIDGEIENSNIIDDDGSSQYEVLSILDADYASGTGNMNSLFLLIEWAPVNGIKCDPSWEYYSDCLTVSNRLIRSYNIFAKKYNKKYKHYEQRVFIPLVDEKQLIFSS